MNQPLLARDGMGKRINLNLTWDNYDNIAFYEEVANGLLQELAQAGGLDSCCDINLIKSEIFKTHTLSPINTVNSSAQEYTLKMGAANAHLYCISHISYKTLAKFGT